MNPARVSALILSVVVLLSAPALCKPDDEKALPDFVHVMKAKVPWTRPLMPMFERAAAKYDVPLPLLLTLGYFGSAFENRGDAPTIEWGYGVMALRENPFGGKSLAEAEALTGVPKSDLKVHPHHNIDAAARVLSRYADEMGIDRSQGLQAWLNPVIRYAGLDEEYSRFFAAEVFDRLRNGLDWQNSLGERFYFPPQDIGSVDTRSLLPSSVRRYVDAQEIAAFQPESAIVSPDGDQQPPEIVGSDDYPPAIWYPAASCNYSAYYTAKDTVVVHTIEGTAAGCLSWFRNCAADVSAHYVISEAGTVWQCVDESYVAWHASCYNSRSIGLEHEGYAASPSHPTSLYNASALLTRDICNSWGIPKEKRTVGPGILGHIDITRCCCGTHTDPGNGWDWNYYIQQVNGTPPPPTWAASYHAQSYPSSMVAGSTAIAWVEYTNTGTGHWTHGDTRLGTSSPQDRSSPFYNSSNWIAPNRPTDVDQSDVGPGQIGRFTFILKAPSTPGTYVEKYRLVQEGVTWFGNEITWTINVTPATGNITGTVRNSADGQPISGATVAITGGPSTTTNTSGVYTFTSIEAGSYTITASKAMFNPSSSSVTVTAGATTTKDFSLTPVDTEPPTAPTGLTATAVSPSQINLSWNAASDNVGVVGYKVYRGGVEIASTTATSYQDNGLPANTAFSYYVKARDAANNLSAASNTATATTFPGAVPIFEDGFANTNYWEAIVQSPMPGPYPPVLVSDKNHGTFAGGYSLKSLSSTDPNQGCLIGHRFDPAFGAAKFETYFFDGTGMDYSAAFETSTEGWVSYPSAYATLTRVSGGASGYCLQASDGGWTSGCYKEITSGFAAGESYTLTMWSKWPGGSYSTPPRCFVRFFDGAGAEIQTDYSANITLDNAWHQYSVSGTIPAGTTRIWVGHWGVRSVSETYLYFADSVTFTTRGPSPVNNNSRQGLQVRCLTPEGGIKAIYYIGTYSVGGPTDAPQHYSVGYYKVCGTGCTGWYWTYNVRQRTPGWHRFTLDFLPYTGSGDVKAYIDGVLVATLDRTLDTQTYGLNMVAYGYHYRVNQESWYDDVAMYATQPHPAPTMGVPQALSPTSIRWNFTDNSNNEFGFRLIDSAGATRATTGAITGTGGTGSIDETGLPPNTPCTRAIRAFNGTLDSFSSSEAVRWTWSAPPTPSNVACDRATDIWYSTPEFRFTAVGGFGVGTVSGYRYAWDQSASHVFDGTEPVWNSGTLILPAASEGDWYLHVQGFNGEGVVNGTLDLGPYRFDGTPPSNPTSAVELHGARNGEWQSTIADPAFSWSGASDSLSGIGGYLVYFGPDEIGTSSDEVGDATCDPAPVTTGTYFLRVCARDVAGNEAEEWKTLFTFKYDSSAPSTPTVTDDGPYTGTKTSLHASWRAVDADSGIAEYQYAVGTSPGGADVVGWTSAGTDDEAIIPIPSPGLQEGVDYYISVKATNAAGGVSEAGSSDGIRYIPATPTISAAKALADDMPVSLVNKVVTAGFTNSCYIQEADRSSGILVLGATAERGSLVTVGGVMGTNAVGERAVTLPVLTLDSPADPLRIPKPLLLLGRDLGGAALNSYTAGVAGHPGLHNVGLLVQVCGRIVSKDDYAFVLSDHSVPVKVLAPGIDLTSFDAGDMVLVTGISSLELEDSLLKPVVRVFDSSGIEKK